MKLIHQQYLIKKDDKTIATFWTTNDEVDPNNLPRELEIQNLLKTLLVGDVSIEDGACFIDDSDD